jgi:hypothetical protein
VVQVPFLPSIGTRPAWFSTRGPLNVFTSTAIHTALAPNRFKDFWLD